MVYLFYLLSLSTYPHMRCWVLSFKCHPPVICIQSLDCGLQAAVSLFSQCWISSFKWLYKVNLNYPKLRLSTRSRSILVKATLDIII